MVYLARALINLSAGYRYAIEAGFYFPYVNYAKVELLHLHQLIRTRRFWNVEVPY
jgi:hypothetical protein